MSGYFLGNYQWDDAEKLAHWIKKDSSGRYPVIIDTDAAAEIDDQFALTYALLSDDCIETLAITSAPFAHDTIQLEQSSSMSYQESMRVCDILERYPKYGLARGADRYIGPESKAAISDATQLIIDTVKKHKDQTVYLIGIAAPTNIVSALMLEPELCKNVVVIWLGGHPYDWVMNNEYNLVQDLRASQLLFELPVRLIHIPCKNVAEQLRTTLPEMEANVKSNGQIGDFLYQRICQFSERKLSWSKVLWDIGPIALLVNHQWVPTTSQPAPQLNDDLTWEKQNDSKNMHVAMDFARDEIFSDFFIKLKQQKDLKYVCKTQHLSLCPSHNTV